MAASCCSLAQLVVIEVIDIVVVVVMEVIDIVVVVVIDMVVMTTTPVRSWPGAARAAAAAGQ